MTYLHRSIRANLSVIILLTFSNNTNAQITIRELNGSANPINTAVPFLTISPDTRANALGGSGVADLSDINSQHWNVSKYASMSESCGISLNYTPWLRTILPDINLLYLAGYYKPTSNQAISASIRYFALPKIYYNTTPPPYKLNPYELALDIGYSRKISESLFTGIIFRYIYSDIAGEGQKSGTESGIGRSIAFDFGTFYTHEIESIEYPSNYSLGLNVSNLGTPISYTDNDVKLPIPANLRLGSSFEISPIENHAFTINLDFNKLLVPTSPIINQDQIIRGMEPADNYFISLIQSIYDAPGIPLENGEYSTVFREELSEIIVNIGLEYSFSGMYYLRGGYFHESEYKGIRQFFSIGGGLKYKTLMPDLAYYVIRKETQSPLRNTISISISKLFK